MVGSPPGQDSDSQADDGAIWPCDLIVTKCTYLATDVLGLSLRRTDGAKLHWEPGAHLAIDLPVDHLARHYSIYGASADGAVQIAVARSRPSRGGSDWLHENAREGLIVKGINIRNNFRLLPAKAYVFVAGGIGITPILPMVRHCVEQGLPWKLLYVGKSGPRMAFLDDIPREGLMSWFSGESGRPDLSGYFENLPPDAGMFACGPAEMLDDLVDISVRRGLRSQLHLERFTAQKVADDTASRDFTVICRRSNQVVNVSRGVSILDALREAGIAHEAQCEQGICGACETRVISGEPDHRDSLLSDDERLDGKTMFICVSRSRSAELVLDI